MWKPEVPQALHHLDGHQPIAVEVEEIGQGHEDAVARGVRHDGVAYGGDAREVYLPPPGDSLLLGLVRLLCRGRDGSGDGIVLPLGAVVPAEIEVGAEVVVEA